VGTLVRPARRPRRDLVAVPVAVGARAVRAVPDGVARRFVRGRSGDGEDLDPHLHFVLLLQRLAPIGLQRDPVKMRADHRRATLGIAGPLVPVWSVTDVRVEGPAGSMAARHYVPPRTTSADEPTPLVVFYHGGGFALGDLDSVDQVCRLLCAHAGVQVLSVEYRLAPENPFPAAVEDADFWFRWAQQRAVGVGADPERVAVAGDSAGGTLAAVVSRRAAVRRRLDPSAPVPAAQLLLYPSTHHHSDFPSRRAFGTGLFLEQEDMDWFFDSYVATAGASPDDPDVSPLLADDLTGLPPTLIITAGFDPLRDEAEAYAARLQEAGVPVLLRRVPGMLHGFFNMTGISRAAHDAVLTTAGAFAAVLAQPATIPTSTSGALDE
jgi:acetyl esterase